MKKLAIALGIVLALLVAADFGGAAYAESKLSEQVRGQLHLNQDPPVTIHGFPFLYQVLVGDYRDVELNAEQVQAGQLHDVGVGAHLHHARIPATDIAAGKTDKLTIDQVDGAIRLKAADVGKLIGINDLRITPAPAEAGSGGPTQAPVTMDGTMNIAGNDLHTSVTAVLALEGGKLRIQPRDLKLSDSSMGDIPLGPLFQKTIMRQFSTAVDPGPLPFGITPTGVSAVPGALVVDASARNVKMADAHGGHP